MDGPAGTSRFDRCRCVLTAVPEGAPPGAPAVPIPYRRCPVGVIADVDCPEYAGARCIYFVEREIPPSVIPRAEVPLLAAELSADYLTPRYRRRIAALRGAAGVGAGPAPGEDVSTAPAWAASAVRGVHAPGVPINVPADRPRRSP